MIAALLCTEAGPVVILTQYDTLDHPRLLELLEQKGISKFIGFKLPLELVQQRYGRHYHAAVENLYESDELRVVDTEGPRAFRLFSFSEMSEPVLYESPKTRVEAPAA